jgi:hypothetical protein
LKLTTAEANVFLLIVSVNASCKPVVDDPEGTPFLQFLMKPTDSSNEFEFPQMSFATTNDSQTNNEDFRGSVLLQVMSLLKLQVCLDATCFAET